MALISVNDTSFDQDVLKADGAILVDFWAEWCGPCKIIAPALEEIANDATAPARARARAFALAGGLSG